MAARFGATIVPFAAVGVDDSLEILADSRQLEAMPIVGDMLRRRGGGLPQARQGVSAAAAEAESFVAPLAVPKLPPNRLYFLFQQPIQTSPEDVKVGVVCCDRLCVVYGWLCILFPQGARQQNTEHSQVPVASIVAPGAAPADDAAVRLLMRHSGPPLSLPLPFPSPVFPAGSRAVRRVVPSDQAVCAGGSVVAAAAEAA
jgi:hypothetical protein